MNKSSPNPQNKSSANKAVTSASKLLSYLQELQKKNGLQEFQIRGLENNSKKIKELIELIQLVKNRDDVREVWEYIQMLHHQEFSGYVGGKEGWEVKKLFSDVWEKVLDFYADMHKE